MVNYPPMDDEDKEALAKIHEEIRRRKDIWNVCPICDELLDVGPVCPYNVCPKGHYEYRGDASYGIIIIEGKEERYYFDDFSDASERFRKRRRVKRGLYRAADGRLFNADVNGSANIGRKVIRNEDLILRLDRSLAARPLAINPLR